MHVGCIASIVIRTYHDLIRGAVSYLLEGVGSAGVLDRQREPYGNEEGRRLQWLDHMLC